MKQHFLQCIVCVKIVLLIFQSAILYQRIYSMQNIFSIFYMFCTFSHHSSATLSKIKLQGMEPYLGPKIPWNYRANLYNR